MNNQHGNGSVKMFMVAMMLVITIAFLSGCNDNSGNKIVVDANTFSIQSFENDAERYTSGFSNTVDMVENTTKNGCGAFNPCN